ncbi:hypothetical protein ABIB06_007051 [Bradyrhizobium sp. LB8.2]
MSAYDRPSSGSRFACPHLGFQHHELDPAPRKIDPQPVMPVEVTAPTARFRSFAGSHAPRWSDGRRAVAPCILARAGGSLCSAEPEIDVAAGGPSVCSRQRGGRARADDLGCAWSVARELFVQPVGGPLRPCGPAARLFGRATAQRSDAANPSIDTETVRRAAEPQRTDIATLTWLAIQLGSLRPVS